MLIAPLSQSLSGIPMFHIKYLTVHKVHMHAGAEESCCVVMGMYGR